MIRRCARRWTVIRTRSIPTSLAILSVILLLAVLAVAGCGGSSDAATTTGVVGASTTSTAGASATTSPSVAASAGPDELGEQIGEVYVAALRDVALMLKDKPDVTGVRLQVENLKNDTITKLVDLGQTREAMSTGDRAKVDAKITAALNAAGSEDWYATYNDVWKHYSSVDSDFANLIAGFNVIGQYANFDLLKKQLPAEAARLGIK
jgi:hypothetical protein